MNKARLFTLAWTLARKAAVRLSTTARAQFGACLKAAWTILRNSKETAMPETEIVAPIRAADEVPAYTPENALRAALGPYADIERFFDAHTTRERVLMLGALLDHNRGREADIAVGAFLSQEEYEGFIRGMVARLFKVDVSTLSHVTAPVAAVETNDARVAFQASVIDSHVRGGGSGAAAWIARIVGESATYGLERVFVARDKRLSGSGRSGHIRFILDRPGIYELRGVQHEAGVASIGRLDSGFLRVGADGSTERLTKAAALEAFGA